MSDRTAPSKFEELVSFLFLTVIGIAGYGFFVGFYQMQMQMRLGGPPHR